MGYLQYYWSTPPKAAKSQDQQSWAFNSNQQIRRYHQQHRNAIPVREVGAQSVTSAVMTSYRTVNSAPRASRRNAKHLRSCDLKNKIKCLLNTFTFELFTCSFVAHFSRTRIDISCHFDPPHRNCCRHWSPWIRRLKQSPHFLETRTAILCAQERWALWITKMGCILRFCNRKAVLPSNWAGLTNV